MQGEAALAFASADMVALSTGTAGRNGTERGTGPALVLHWARAGLELEDMRPQQWKEENGVQRIKGWAEGRSPREGGSRKGEPTSAHCNPRASFLYSVTDPHIPRQF